MLDASEHASMAGAVLGRNRPFVQIPMIDVVTAGGTVSAGDTARGSASVLAISRPAGFPDGPVRGSPSRIET